MLGTIVWLRNRATRVTDFVEPDKFGWCLKRRSLLL